MNLETYEEDLVYAAVFAASCAYAPYSKFHVGAAVLCEDGSTIVGCNVENASYGLTICAERNAIFSAIAQGKAPTKIAVTCLNAKDLPAQYKTPCGACRQVMQEFLNNDGIVIVDGVGRFKMEELLPLAFKL